MRSRITFDTQLKVAQCSRMNYLTRPYTCSRIDNNYGKCFFFTNRMCLLSVKGGSEVSEEKRADEEPDTAAIKTDDGEDLDNDDDDEDVSSVNEVEDNGSSGCRMAEVYSKEKAPTEKMVRYLGKDVELKTFQVKIYKLPVSVGNGRPRVVDGLQSPINRTSQSENEAAQADEEEGK